MVGAHRLLVSILVLFCAGFGSGCQTRGTDQTAIANFPLPVTSWPLADDSAPSWRISSEFSAFLGRGPETRTFRALLTLERSGDQLHFIALSPIGVPLFTATLRANGDLAIHQQVATSFKPERVLAELQFCLWPSTLLQGAYTQPWFMTEDSNSRTLHRHGVIVATAQWMEAVNNLSLREKAARAVTLEHRQQDYVIRISPLLQSNAR